MDKLQRKLCDVQGKIFELSCKDEYDSKEFITKFMKSDIARGLDDDYNRAQWAGEAYLYGDFADNNSISKGVVFDKEILYWIGYIYRFWHYYTRESSKTILKQAGPATMCENYYMFHTMDPVIAIQNLKEINTQTQKQHKTKKST